MQDVLSNFLERIRSSRSILKIQLPEKIKLHTYVRLQIRLVYNEIQAKLNDGNLATSMAGI